jgi:hypothetical protein
MSHAAIIAIAVACGFLFAVGLVGVLAAYAGAKVADAFIKAMERL